MVNYNKRAIQDDFVQAHGEIDEEAIKIFHADIPDINNTDPATRERMLILKDSIDPYDLNTINVYAIEPGKELTETSRYLVERANNVGGLLKSFDSFRDRLTKFDFETVSNTAQKYAGIMQRKAARVSQTLLRNPLAIAAGIGATILSGGMAGAAIGLSIFGMKETARKFRKKFKQPTAEDLRHQIDDSMLQLGDIISDLEEAQNAIPSIVDDINKLRTAKTIAYSELGVYIGAARARYLEIKTVMIPTKQTEAKGGSLLAQQDLGQLRTAQEVLNKRLLLLQTFHGTSLGDLSSLQDLTRTLSLSHVNISGHLTISQSEWMGILAQASITARTSEVAEVVANADKFGDQIFDANAKLSSMARNMAVTSFQRGGVDPKKIVNFLNEQAKAIVGELNAMRARNEGVELSQKNIETATRNLLLASARAGLTELGSENISALTSAPKVSPEETQDAVLSNKPITKTFSTVPAEQDRGLTPS